MSVGLLLLLALACLVAGTAIALVARRRDRRLPAALVSLVLLGTVTTTLLAVGTEASAQAVTSGCSSSHDLLIVTQTSTMAGLAPGIAPVPITGRLVNNSEHSTNVAAVKVEITSLTPGRGSAADTCGARDYRLSASRMPVGRTLGPGASTSFRGASIGFSTNATNQDACQGATVHLRYTAILE